MDKKLIILLVIIFISISCFSATPPTNKSPNGIIDWTNNNFVASDSWTSSGTTQIYSLKSVGIGTNTPDVNYKLNVFGNSYLDGEYLWLDKENNIYLRRGYGAPYNLSFYCGNNEKLRCSGYSYSALYGNWLINGSMTLYGNYANITWYGTGSKVYSPSTNIISINNNSNETLRLTDLNNVLIGTTVDDGINKLQVNGNAYISSRVLVATTTADNNADITTGGKIRVGEYVKQLNNMAQIDMVEVTTSQSIPSGNSWTELDFSTNGHDHYEVGDCDADASNNKITINATGVYEISLEMSFYGDTNGLEWKFNALVDGVQSHCGCFQEIGSGWSAVDKFSIAASSIVEVDTAPADITIGVKHDDSSSVNLYPYRAMLRVKYLGEIK